mmetsp:Transcript_2440/g.10338  ORF Transcript_2440/g.10338 Transcript_2440/m.10338 type:complete len:241 (+) Transcript_2440:381-1103(+)
MPPLAPASHPTRKSGIHAVLLEVGPHRRFRVPKLHTVGGGLDRRQDYLAIPTEMMRSKPQGNGTLRDGRQNFVSICAEIVRRRSERSFCPPAIIPFAGVRPCADEVACSAVPIVSLRRKSLADTRRSCETPIRKELCAIHDLHPHHFDDCRILSRYEEAVFGQAQAAGLAQLDAVLRRDVSQLRKASLRQHCAELICVQPEAAVSQQGQFADVAAMADHFTDQYARWVCAGVCSSFDLEI